MWRRLGVESMESLDRSHLDPWVTTYYSWRTEALEGRLDPEPASPEQDIYFCGI